VFTEFIFLLDIKQEKDIITLPMSQNLTSSPIAKVIYSTITSKGQVTIPVAIQRHLRIATNYKIAFIIQPEGTVQVKTPKYSTIASLADIAGKLKRPSTGGK